MPYPTRKYTYVGLGVVFIITIGLHYAGVLSPLERGLRALTVPLLGNLHTINIEVGDSYQFFKNKDAFIKAYQQCLASNERQTTLSSDVLRLEDENTELKKQLAYIEKNKPNFILARVVGREISGIDQTIIINRGSNDASRVDLPVVVGNGILVGKVIKVEPDISIVRLINDNQSRVAGTILNNDKSLGVVEGGFGISLQMNLIPRNEVVQVGDQVITSGLEKNMPRGLVLGTIAGVENEAYKPFQRGILTPGTDLNKLTVVTILSTN